ncbi:MAG TPA: FAD-dependent oxidoreductase [Acidimicrobiales bacterium]|nr:FAD-dependent oxidoreductase [Acidimicrobiales bacterium]
MSAGSGNGGASAGLRADGTVVVVGASLAGLRAVQGFRDEEFKGRLVLVGDELHYPYDRPPLSKQVLAGTWPPERAVLADYHKLHDLGVEVHVGRRAVSLDIEGREVALDDGTSMTADGIVVATGARARRLRGTDGADGVMVLRTLDDCERLRARLLSGGPGTRVVVVGAGFIGSEVASTCSELGCHVTVVEALPTPLAPALGELVGAACGALHTRHGVTLLTGVGVVAVHPPGGGEDGAAPDEGTAGRVELDDGTNLAADVVVVGIGVVPNTEWLDGSGLTVEDGLVCDAGLFAADGVVAAGDVARWTWRHHGQEESTRIEHWETAAQMGQAAARSLLAGRADAEPFDPVPYFWSDQYGLRIQMLGRPAPTDEVAVVDGALDSEDGRFVAVYGRAGRLTAALAVGRPRLLMGFRPLLVAGASFGEALAHLPAS